MIKFIELTKSEATSPEEAKISVNVAQIVSFEPDKDGTLIYYPILRKDDRYKCISVIENYETVKSLVTS